MSRPRQVLVVEGALIEPYTSLLNVVYMAEFHQNTYFQSCKPFSWQEEGHSLEDVSLLRLQPPPLLS
jgi:hypothetical protein